MFYLIDGFTLHGAMYPKTEAMYNAANKEAKSLLIIWYFIGGFSEMFVPCFIEFETTNPV